jgi:DNA-binding transcriptional MerR regulator
LAERTYLSIGDVLSLLKDEFPDITISKIRFLESQGLLDPERTPSGYRKFYEEDVDRLRWILRQQRENFLPLKVIKGRLRRNGGLAEGESPDPDRVDPAGRAGAGAGVGVARKATGSRSVAGVAAIATLRPREAGTAGTPAQGPGERPRGAAGGARVHQGPEGGQDEPAEGAHDLDREPPAQEGRAREARARERTGQTSTPSPTGVRSRFGVPSQQRGGRPDAGALPADTRGRGGSPGRSAPATPGAGVRPDDATLPRSRPDDTGGPGSRPDDTAGPRSRPDDTAGPGGRPDDTAGPAGRREGSAGPRPAPPETTEEQSGGPLSIGLSGVNLTAGELSEASGLSEEDLRELERYGLLVGRPVGDTVYFDEESLTVARLSAGFRRFGIEARHLRMYRTAADREASFFEQIVMPMLKQRNPVARRRAVETLTELARLGQGLRGSLLRSALRDNTGG